MNKRITDRYGFTKKIKISYSAEISDQDFNNYCMMHRVDRNSATKLIKELAINASEQAINNEIQEVNLQIKKRR
tara:strand:+ start:3749 stop:3970 length:222 start_codon:yes stop_codon:yes gene_type:complete